jgi:hypothetical protein
VDWDLEPGEQIRRVELHLRYGGGRQSGISPSRSSPNVLVFSDPGVGAQHGYNDSWSSDGRTFFYAGEGQQGDQQYVRGNRAIGDHRINGKALRVFWGAGGIVQYAGEFVVDEEDPLHLVKARETGSDRLRNVIMFHLHPVGEPEAPDPQRPQRMIVKERKQPELNSPYRPADEDPKAGPRDPMEVDPHQIERGLAGHARVQNELARLAEALELSPLSPGASDPDFDLAWRDDSFVVVECKSLTTQNERGQLRLGLGQVSTIAVN